MAISPTGVAVNGRVAFVASTPPPHRTSSSTDDDDDDDGGGGGGGDDEDDDDDGDGGDDASGRSTVVFGPEDVVESKVALLQAPLALLGYGVVEVWLARC